MQNVIDGKA
ncbi:thermitase domain protein, partial [Vibrio parahaemolyticus V-223/04]